MISYYFPILPNIFICGLAAFAGFIHCNIKISNSATEITEKIHHIAQWIAEHFGELNRQQIANISTAARIALIGKIFLPDELLHQPPTVNGIATHQLMHQIPYCSDKILEPMPSLHPIRTILHSLFENYDGTGFPDRIEKGIIPIESRILRVAYDFQMYRYAFSLSAYLSPGARSATTSTFEYPRGNFCWREISLPTLG